MQPFARRVGLTPDELLARTWSAVRPPRYAAQVGSLRVLEGETVALVGAGAALLLETFLDALPRVTVVDGHTAAVGGVLRIHAQQAARVGVPALAVTEPFAELDPAAQQLAVADLAGLSDLGLTVLVVAADPGLAALIADRICLVNEAGVPGVAYPVVAPTPRRPADVAPVTERVTARLTALPADAAV